MHDQPSAHPLFARLRRTGPPVGDDVHGFAGGGERLGDVTQISANASREIRGRRVLARKKEMRQVPAMVRA